ncbi:shikimate dehydrogenase [Leptobacterium flavescens]|uniref:Shikimate dehydrogenase n=1 Tax=Leptobacterium flavescens TaxID=472055 RepID=A0A6P0UP05_9FLAO|nr:shikimate dehydrogenase [Leptobacterium flavescens]NER14170.1 shikimate dehydrogenase [Leptobacterium flavescens]
MEKKHENILNLFGLIGKNISYSFSQGYFNKKFENSGLQSYLYTNFDLPAIEAFQEVIANTLNLKGLNVTIPYKEAIIPYLNELDSDAAAIGAVNTIKIEENGLKGFNTDHHGFRESIHPFLKEHHKKALILGTGGASKAIAFVFDRLGIDYAFVSRKKARNQFTYNDLNQDLISSYPVIVNCTPLGTFPDIENKPSIPYEFITSGHLLYDLIYNPEETSFLKLGRERGAQTLNGLQMLELQAEKAWEIWNS